MVSLNRLALRLPGAAASSPPACTPRPLPPAPPPRPALTLPLVSPPSPPRPIARSSPPRPSCTLRLACGLYPPRAPPPAPLAPRLDRHASPSRPSPPRPADASPNPRASLVPLLRPSYTPPAAFRQPPRVHSTQRRALRPPRQPSVGVCGHPAPSRLSVRLVSGLSSRRPAPEASSDSHRATVRPFPLLSTPALRLVSVRGRAGAGIVARGGGCARTSACRPLRASKTTAAALVDVRRGSYARAASREP